MFAANLKKTSIMKKITLLLCAFALVLTSCNKDDDNNEATQDQLIGTWKFYKSFENDVEDELETCETEETVVISADGTYSWTYFDENEDGDCVPNSDVEIGTWQNVGQGNYSFTTDGETDVFSIYFADNTFYTLYSYTFEEETMVYKEVYIRN